MQKKNNEDGGTCLEQCAWSIMGAGPIQAPDVIFSLWIGVP